jgi:hypothetical protein
LYEQRDIIDANSVFESATMAITGPEMVTSNKASSRGPDAELVEQLSVLIGLWPCCRRRLWGHLRRRGRGQTTRRAGHLGDLPTVLTLLRRRLATFMLEGVFPVFTPFAFMLAITSSSPPRLIDIGGDIAGLSVVAGCRIRRRAVVAGSDIAVLP